MTDLEFIKLAIINTLRKIPRETDATYVMEQLLWEISDLERKPHLTWSV